MVSPSSSAAAPRVVHVLHASETGNATEIARSIHEQLLSYGFTPGALLSLADFPSTFTAVLAGSNPDPNPNPNPPSWRPADGAAAASRTVMVVSTTGDGDAPDCARPFLRFLRKVKKDGATRYFDPEADDAVAPLRFAMLGLGDTNYEAFCGGSKRCDKALKELGARPFYARGEADDAVGLEQFVEPWVEGLWGALEKDFGGGKEKTVAREHIDDALALPRLLPISLTMEDADGQEVHSRVDKLSPSTHSTSIPMRIRLANRLSDGRKDQAVKTVWHVEMELLSDSSPPLSYSPGDAFAILPENTDTDVDQLLKLLEIPDPGRIVTLRGDNVHPRVVGPASIRRLVQTRVDLHSPPRKTFLRALAEHCRDADDTHHLHLLSSRQGKAAYTKLFIDEQWSVLDLLHRHPSCRPPVELLLDQLAPLAPRYYSAASAVEADGDRCVHFAFSVVERVGGPAREARRGLVTGRLHDMCEGAVGRGVGGNGEEGVVYVMQRPATRFVPPVDASVPYVMVGPGTGVAPFRGFLRQRDAAGESGAGAAVWLFCGNRYEERDFLYGEELARFKGDGVLSELETAFSRDRAEKVYVQDRIEARGEELFNEVLSKEDFRIYVCGDGSGMATGVHSALTRVLAKEMGISVEDADKTLMQWSKAGKYLKDIWYWGTVED